MGSLIVGQSFRDGCQSPDLGVVTAHYVNPIPNRLRNSFGRCDCALREPHSKIVCETVLVWESTAEQKSNDTKQPRESLYLYDR